MTPQDFFTELLTQKPEARATTAIQRCMQAAFKHYKYIKHDSTWDSDRFLSGQYPTLQSIDRALREVKKANGWQDDKAKEKEGQYRDQYSGHPSTATHIHSSGHTSPTQESTAPKRPLTGIENQESLDRRMDSNSIITKAYAEERGISVEEAARLLGV